MRGFLCGIDKLVSLTRPVYFFQMLFVPKQLRPNKLDEFSKVVFVENPVIFENG